METNDHQGTEVLAGMREPASVETGIGAENGNPVMLGRVLNIRVYETLDELAKLRPDWEALLDRYPYSTTFSAWEWLSCWWRAFGSESRLLALAAFDKNDLVGLALFTIAAEKGFAGQLRVLRLLGDGSHDSDNLDIPVVPGYEGLFTSALLYHLEKRGSLWDICQLRTMPQESPVGKGMGTLLKEKGWTPHFSSRPQSVVDLPETWEEYTKSLSAKERGKIGIRFRKLEKKYKLEIGKCRAEAELDECLNALSELHRRHWEQRGLPGTLHIPARRQFYRELASSLLKRSRLEFWILKLDEKIVAAQFGLRHGKTVFSLQEGFDPEFSSDSVGYVLRSQALKTLIADGVRRYDFLGGTDESKLRWGAQVLSYRNIEFARPRTRGSLQLTFKYKSAEAKEWLRQRLPTTMFQNLKRLTGRG